MRIEIQHGNSRSAWRGTLVAAKAHAREHRCKVLVDGRVQHDFCGGTARRKNPGSPQETLRRYERGEPPAADRARVQVTTKSGERYVATLPELRASPRGSYRADIFNRVLSAETSGLVSDDAGGWAEWRVFRANGKNGARSRGYSVSYLLPSGENHERVFAAEAAAKRLAAKWRSEGKPARVSVFHAGAGAERAARSPAERKGEQDRHRKVQRDRAAGAALHREKLAELDKALAWGMITAREHEEARRKILDLTLWKDRKHNPRRRMRMNAPRMPSKAQQRALIEAWARQYYSRTSAPLKTQEKLFDIYQKKLAVVLKLLEAKSLSASNQAGMEDAGRRWWNERAMKGAGVDW